MSVSPEEIEEAAEDRQPREGGGDGREARLLQANVVL